MKFESTLLVVTDMEKSKEFYKSVLGLEITLDFDANVTLSGGIVLQTLDTWGNFIQDRTVVFQNHAQELYFEEEDMDAFCEKLKQFDVEYLHPLKAHPWGQRVIRFYDPDHHVIEVGEQLTMVVKRFVEGGMSIERTAVKMDVPIEYIESCLERK